VVRFIVHSLYQLTKATAKIQADLSREPFGFDLPGILGVGMNAEQIYGTTGFNSVPKQSEVGLNGLMHEAFMWEVQASPKCLWVIQPSSSSTASQRSRWLGGLALPECGKYGLLVVVETVRPARMQPLLPRCFELDNFIGVHIRRDAL
jgi:hypothetical protein